MDGLKIEPLPEALVGRTGEAPPPLRDWSALHEPLDARTPSGFGGVSEYGITVRWDKNFLRLIHLTLARRPGFRAFGGVRFGGTLTLDDAWELGFHHVAMATGAGRPTIVEMKNNLTRGVRKASDFLMALQLTGAFRRESLANLQVELPALVVGGGLTAIDTATELMAYYPVQSSGCSRGTRRSSPRPPRARCSRPERGRARDPRALPRARPRAARRAGGRGTRRPGARLRPAAARVGRRHDLLSQGPR